MFDAKITFSGDAMRNLRREIKTAPKEFVKRVNTYIDGAEQRLADKLTVVPPRKKGSLRWARSKHPADADKKPNTKFGYYSRQKAWWFATRRNADGTIKAYNRTGKLARSWRIVRRGNQYAMTIVARNTQKYAEFVIGDWQQPFHADTGWPLARKILTDEQTEMSKRIVSYWHEIQRERRARAKG